MKHKAFPCGNSFGANLQYNEKKTSQKIIVRLIVQKQTAPLWMFWDLKSCMLKTKTKK